MQLHEGIKGEPQSARSIPTALISDFIGLASYCEMTALFLEAIVAYQGQSAEGRVHI
jgi:hypothetical protein